MMERKKSMEKGQHILIVSFQVCCGAQSQNDENCTMSMPKNSPKPNCTCDSKLFYSQFYVLCNVGKCHSLMCFNTMWETIEVYDTEEYNVKLWLQVLGLTMGIVDNNNKIEHHRHHKLCPNTKIPSFLTNM